MPPNEERRGSPEVLAFAENILPHIQEQFQPISKIGKDTRALVRLVLEIVFADAGIEAAFKDAAIRLTAMRGEVARLVLKLMDQDPNAISPMAIGDIELPPDALIAAEKLLQQKHHFEIQFAKEQGFGYDLSAQGLQKARQAMLDFFNIHYNFSSSPEISAKLLNNSTITAGAMPALDAIANAMIFRDPNHRFIQPDNSFGTWHTLVKTKSPKNVHTVPTHQQSLLHLTADDVNNFYNQKGRVAGGNTESWYLTPVGNPSGTKMQPQQFKEVCEAILNNNPCAILIVDCAYVRTLKPKKAQELMAEIIVNPAITDRIIFVESFSKSHGLCGERIGAFFSSNDELYRMVQYMHMLATSGVGRDKSALVMAIATCDPQQQEAIKMLHEFWSHERRGLYHYLMKNQEFSHLFDEDQSHILPEQLEESLGLYVFLKLKQGVGVKEVAIETGCLGVETQMGNDRYIRFAVGKITAPTYSKYLEGF